MDTQTIQTYLNDFLVSGSEDAFHCLIEGQEPVADAILSRLQRSDLSIGNFRSLLDVLKEIRTSGVSERLLKLLAVEDGERWHACIECYWHNHSATDLTVSQGILRELLQDESLCRTKVAHIEEILASTGSSNPSG